MNFNVFLIVGILFKMALRAESGLLSGLLGQNCGCSDWQAGVKKSREGVERIVEKYPKSTYAFGQTIASAYGAQIDNLKNLVNSTEPILSNSAVKLLESLSLLSKVDNTPETLLYQLEKTLAEKTQGYRTTVKNLNATIGELEEPINKVIANYQDTVLCVLKQFNRRFIVRKEKRSEMIDFKALVRSFRRNSFAVAFVAETVISSVDAFAPESLQAVAVFTFISNLQALGVHGANVNMGTILVSETNNVSPLLHLCFQTVDPLIADITNLISSASFENVETTAEYLKNYVQMINSYKEPFENLLGPFEGVGITEAEVIENLAKS